MSWKDSFTDESNALELILYGTAIALAVGLALQAYVVLAKGAVFSFIDFGVGVGGLLGGTGVGYVFKKIGDKNAPAASNVPQV